jgi:hypothetical protein
MEMKVQVPFQQLLTLIKTLTPTQKLKLRKELDESSVKPTDDFIDFLLQGPVYTDKDIAVIEENRKSISEWRTKN